MKEYIDKIEKFWYEELDTGNVGTIKRKKFFYFLAEKKILFSPDVTKVDDFLKL